jgi:raffinose/stachyose/melibiose transport system permease protein
MLLEWIKQLTNNKRLHMKINKTTHFGLFGNVTTLFLRYFVLLFVVLICLLPLIWVFISSFKTNSEILSSALTLPLKASFGGYISAVQITNLQMRFITSLIVTTSTTAIAVVIYSMSAYVLARGKFKLKGFIFAVLISSILIPTNAMIQPVYTVIKSLNLYDTKWALILVYTAFSMPMCLFLMRSYFLSIPKELEESAYLEGASFLRTFWSIMLPCAKPALASASVLTFIAAWNELMYVLLLTSSERNRTMPLAMKYFTSMFSFNYSAMFAAVVLCVLPTIIIYIILQEQIMESVVAGSVKG